MKKIGTVNQLLDALNLQIKLTADQRKALEALEWLGVNGPLKSGRTMVMALSAIKTAMDNPGMRVVLVDHWPGERGAEVLSRSVSRLLASAPEALRARFTLNKTGSLVYGTPSSGPVEETAEEVLSALGDRVKEARSQSEPCCYGMCVAGNQHSEDCSHIRHVTVDHAPTAEEIKEIAEGFAEEEKERVQRRNFAGVGHVFARFASYDVGGVQTGRLRSDRPNYSNRPCGDSDSDPQGRS